MISNRPTVIRRQGFLNFATTCDVEHFFFNRTIAIDIFFWFIHAEIQHNVADVHKDPFYFFLQARSKHVGEMRAQTVENSCTCKNDDDGDKPESDCCPAKSPKPFVADEAPAIPFDDIV